MKLSFLSALLLALPGFVSGNIVYVDKSAPEGGDGSSWESAFNNLQDGINSGAGGEVWIAGGTYTPESNQTLENQGFNIETATILRGGFAAGDRELNDRKLGENRTYISGDLLYNDTEEWNANLRTENSRLLSINSNVTYRKN